MNLAILVSVSDYEPKLSNLPACKNDYKLIESILKHSGKFSDVLTLTSDTSSSHIKSELARFVKQHQGSSVSELFFYYTGHGDFFNDDLYLLFSDYDKSKQQQTSLSNRELDEMLRSLSPSLAVKLIDACHSGVTYVKNPKSLEKAIEATKGQYDKCYFLFSSQREETSYQDEHLSDFTESFARSLSEHKYETIRYKDIIDYISDEFKSQGGQTPFFVIQADFTDLFCTISQDMRKEVRAILDSSLGKKETILQDVKTTHTTTPIHTDEAKPSIRELVSQDASRYCTEQEAMSAISSIKSHIESHKLNPDLSDIFDIQYHFRSDFAFSPRMSEIANWIHMNDNDYFVTVEYRTEEYETTSMIPKPIPSSIFGRSLVSSIAALGGAELEEKVVKKKRKVPNSISLNVSPSFCAAEIKLIPKYENLPWLSEHLIIVFSKSTLRLFFTTVRYKEKNWNERIIEEGVRWKTKSVGLKDNTNLKSAVLSICHELDELALKLVHEKFKISDFVKVDGEQ